MVTRLEQAFEGGGRLSNNERARRTVETPFSRKITRVRARSFDSAVRRDRPCAEEPGRTRRERAAASLLRAVAVPTPRTPDSNPTDFCQKCVALQGISWVCRPAVGT